MTSAEQTEAGIQQAELDRAQAGAREAEATARAAELEHARATAAPGERLQCIRAESFPRGQMHCELSWPTVESTGTGAYTPEPPRRHNAGS